MSLSLIKSISSEPRFGWTRDSLRPEAYTRPLKLGRDIVVQQDKSLQATPSFVQDLATRMQETALTAPRFVLLPNLTDFSQRIEDLRAFQKSLFDQVCRAVFTKPNYRINHVTRGDGVATRLDNGQPVDRLWTLKDLHQDANATFFSHLYGPIQHVKGGALTLLTICSF